MSGDAHVRICESCALEARKIQSHEMVTSAKPNQQPGTEFCVASGNGPLRSVDREEVGRNESERKDSPEIERGRRCRPPCQ